MSRAPRAFSLVETLVVIAVVLILSATLLSAILSARDANRREGCVDNLRRLGVALHNYHAVRNCYPLGVTASQNPMSGSKVAGQPTDWSGWSPQAQMLPYLDQRPLYDAINFDFDPFINLQEPINATVHQSKLEQFLCSADPYVGQEIRNSYYGSIGTNFQSEARRSTGVFAYQTPYRISDVTDGLANTVAFAEGRAGDWRPRRFRGNGVVNAGVKNGNPGAPDRLTAEKEPDRLKENLKLCNDAFLGVGTPPAAFSGNRGQHWTWGTEGMTLFNTIVPPNSTEYAFNQCRYDCTGCFLQDADHSDIVNAGSYHPGGANVLFCDGTVRFLKGSMSLPTWWALGTRGGGEDTTVDSY